MRQSIYLDYAAATPLDKRVFAAMQPYLSEVFYNPSAMYSAARQVRADFEDAKSRLGAILGVKSHDIIMTAGATESIYIALEGVMESGDHMVIGATEHAAVRAVGAKYAHSVAAASSKGIITPEAVEAVITDATKVVSIAAADSELGTVQSLRAIAEKLRDIRHDRALRGIKQPLYLHSDASQVAGVIDLHVSRLGVDMLTLNAGKCYGPKQVGLLWVDSSVRLQPVLAGGGQERGLRGGTENVAGTVGFAVALEYADKKRHTESKRLAELRDRLQGLLTTELPELVINGHAKKRLPGHLHISYAGLDAERAVMHLDLQGVCVATGAACAANKGTRSSVLSGVGMSDELADGSLRISLGRNTTLEEIDDVAPLIAQAIRTEAAL